jgi:hypothetical protein
MPGAAPNYISKFSRVKFGGPADQRNGYTTIVDGGDLDDAIWGDPTVNISQDAVQEFKVFRNQFDAQYGAALAAVVTVPTKSGHLARTPPGDQGRPPLQRPQFVLPPLCLR